MSGIRVAVGQFNQLTDEKLRFAEAFELYFRRDEFHAKDDDPTAERHPPGGPAGLGLAQLGFAEPGWARFGRARPGSGLLGRVFPGWTRPSRAQLGSTEPDLARLGRQDSAELG